MDFLSNWKKVLCDHYGTKYVNVLSLIIGFILLSFKSLLWSYILLGIIDAPVSDRSISVNFLTVCWLQVHFLIYSSH